MSCNSLTQASEVRNHLYTIMQRTAQRHESTELPYDTASAWQNTSEGLTGNTTSLPSAQVRMDPALSCLCLPVQDLVLDADAVGFAHAVAG